MYPLKQVLGGVVCFCFLFVCFCKLVILPFSKRTEFWQIETLQTGHLGHLQGPLVSGWHFSPGWRASGECPALRGPASSAPAIGRLGPGCLGSARVPQKRPFPSFLRTRPSKEERPELLSRPLTAQAQETAVCPQQACAGWTRGLLSGDVNQCVSRWTGADGPGS